MGASLRLRLARCGGVAVLSGLSTLPAGAGCSSGEVTIGEQEASTLGDDASGDAFCVNNKACLVGTHWDAAACACVPDDGGTAASDARDGCVDTIYCAGNTRWDPQLCTCVPLDAGTFTDGGVCVSTQGGQCGGNIVNPCVCAAGLRCVNDAAVVGDVGGTCQP
jgi:hypothetical protein